MFTTLLTCLRKFRADQRGYITIEAAIVLPALLWLFGVGWVYFDAFRQQSVNQKANYVIGDMISRETDPVDDPYIDNAFKLLNVLNRTMTGGSDLRITVVRYDADRARWRLQWSETRGTKAPLANGDIRNLANYLPVAGHLDELVVVETWEEYHPVFQVGLSDFDIYSYSFTRPRYAPRILFAGLDENNGWGNGDQEAPGDSLCNNNAENATDCLNDAGQTNIEPSQTSQSGI